MWAWTSSLRLGMTPLIGAINLIHVWEKSKINENLFKYGYEMNNVAIFIFLLFLNSLLFT